MKSVFTLLLALSACLPLSAAAVNQQIRAIFKPNPANPLFNQFENMTPTSGFCLDNPPQCANEKLFSLRLPIQSWSNATIQGGHSNPRRGAMFNIPSQWQTITLSHPTAPPQVVEFRVAGMGVAYRLPKPAPQLTDGLGHNYLWEGGIWSYAGPPCAGLGGAGNDIGFNSFWKHPENAGGLHQAGGVQYPPAIQVRNLRHHLPIENPRSAENARGAIHRTARNAGGAGA